MNPKLLIPFLLFMLLAGRAAGQIAYHDAVALSRYIDENTNKFITQDKPQPGGTPLTADSLFGILKVYLPDSVKNQDNLTNDDIKEFYQKHNNFIGQFYNVIAAAAGGSGTPTGKAGQFISNVGNIDVTNLAVAVADFLIERSKEELTVTFFDRLKRDLNNYPELRTLFPTTTGFLDAIASYQYGVMLQVLRQSFNADFSSLSTRFRNLRSLSISDCQSAAKRSDCEGRIRFLTNFFSQPASMYYVSATIAIDSLNRGSNLGNIISAIAADAQIAKFPESNVANAIKLTNLFSESFRSTTGEKVWIDSEDLKAITGTKNNLDLYLGLIYQNSSNRGIHFKAGTGTALVKLADRLDKLRGNTGFLVEFVSRAETINEQVEEIRKKKQDGTPFKVEEYFEYANAAVSLVEGALDLNPVFEIAPPAEFREYVTLSRSAINLYYNLKSKDYSSAVFNSVVILEKSFGKDFTYKDKVLKYGSFMAAVAEAETSDQIKGAIEAVALPAGSSRIKRETAFNVSLNGYLGPFAGGETLYELPKNNRTGFALGPFVPVGIGANFGIPPKAGNKLEGGKSFSIFLSLIDVGAIAAFRISQTKVEAETPTNPPATDTQTDINAAVFPRIRLQNIVAPGLFTIFGFGRSPFALGAGVQVGPSLRKITATEKTAATPDTPAEEREITLETRNNFYLRYSLFFTVDVPLLNLYTKPRARQ